MRPAAIVEVEVTSDRRARLGRGVVGSEIHLLIFDATPQPLDEDVVAPGALAVHADADPVFNQHASESRAGELAALVRVEDLRLTVASESVLEGLDAERRLHRDRYSPRQHATAEPIEHDSQIDEAALHRDVGDERLPAALGRQLVKPPSGGGSLSRASSLPSRSPMRSEGLVPLCRLI